MQADNGGILRMLEELSPRFRARRTGSTMVVWGGRGSSGAYATGGIYDPGTNSWTLMSTTGAPRAAEGATGVWTGSRVLVWGGGALLGWIAGDVMVKDAALADWLSQPVVELLHIWGGPVGGIIVVGAGYVLVGKHRRLILDEVLAGIALLIWIVVDRVSDSLFGGPDPDLVKIWSVRGGLLAVLIVVYAIARSLWHVEQKELDKEEAAE